MTYKAKDFSHLLGMTGFSDKMLNNHFTLYQGYVKNTNSLNEKLSDLAKKGKTGEVEYAEIHRRYGWEYNGMRLHEIYFGNLAKSPAPLNESSDLARQIQNDFGGVDDWRRAFKGVGEMRGVGWALLAYDAEDHRLFNTWINEHNANWPAATTPLLLMDVWEHAFMLDFGLKRGDYIDTFFRKADWETAARRFHTTTRELTAAS